jgi:predicted RNA-binding Zn-ribbon protein involved in translation (DUF1610 family)
MANSYTMVEVQYLITEAQTGSMAAMDDLIAHIMKDHAPRITSKWTRKNTVSGMDKDDIEQIFLIGCSNAIIATDPHIGNPLNFIIQKGVWAIKDELRKNYRKDLRQYCTNCDSDTRLNQEGGQYVCPKCGARGADHIETYRRNSLDDGTVTSMIADESMLLDDRIVEEDVVGTFRARLSGKKLEVFDMIMIKGFDRDSCKNYIGEIAEHMGVSKGNINLRLRAIKEDWKEYREEIEWAGL